MATALALERPIFLGMNLSREMQVIDEEEEEEEEEEVRTQHQEVLDLDVEQLGQGSEQDLQDSSLFGTVQRQRRRQDIPRARRRCFSSFDSPCSVNHESRCSRIEEETAVCSKAASRRDCMDTPGGSGRSPVISTNWSEDGESSHSCALWSPDELVWAKFSRSPWWPAQVVDNRAVGASILAQRQSKNHVLVRFFGNYNYGWVDPASNLSKFDTDYEERCQVATKAFQKGLKEALEYRGFRKLPLKWRHEECQTPHTNGKESSEDTGSEALESDRTTSVRKRKPKVLYEEEERLHHKPKRNLRRKRIMRELGLCAPYGSPFTTGTNF